MKSYWTVEDLANELQVTTRTIRNYLKSGELTGSKVGGQWRFTLDDVRKLTGVTNPIIEFSESSVSSDSFQESLVAFNVPIKKTEDLLTMREQIIEQYNQVYFGNNRKFYFELISQTHFRVVLSGSRKYTLNFGSWIEQNFF
ncbi:helix-turn-helix domain-containing protein [Paenibacillus sp. FSL M7-0656]|uniref:helix-turn-helix domain-containing protein n=1 Tax=Paenibacillus sp. FSL M7-0656 TaxID=2921534 RepID=UPI0030F704DE